VAPVKRIAHVIWDWNGTLLDDAELCVEVMNGVLSRRQLAPITAESYAAAFRFPVRDYYRDLGFDFEREAFEIIGTEFISAYSAGEARCSLRHDARSTLEGVEKLGLSQSVLSASQQARLEHQVKRLEVHAHFEALVGLADNYAAGKIEVGKKWMAKSDVDPDRTVLVGDTDHDVEVARALGVKCLLVPSGHQSTERLARTGAEVLPTLSAMLRVLG
jgi:phosphoglycolate phosphatase